MPRLGKRKLCPLSDNSTTSKSSGAACFSAAMACGRMRTRRCQYACRWTLLIKLVRLSRWAPPKSGGSPAARDQLGNTIFVCDRLPPLTEIWTALIFTRRPWGSSIGQVHTAGVHSDGMSALELSHAAEGRTRTTNTPGSAILASTGRPSQRCSE
jgi:hypothetical protein